MKRFLSLSGLLFLALTFWSSTAVAESTIYYGKGETWSISSSAGCEALIPGSPYDESTPVGDANPAGPFENSSRWGMCNFSSSWHYSTSSTQMNWKLAPALCATPNYIDVVSGECVPPVEKCITDLESMAEECLLLREDDPDGLNCVTNSSGLELCLDDNPLCYSVEGKSVCPDPDSVCGYKNGSFSCIAPEAEGCGTFNGERVCLTPDGDKVDPDSPDHPDNGGNLDGDETNDVTDSRDSVDGGDPDNQPGENTDPIDTLDADRSTEATSRDQLEELKNIDDRLRKISEGPAPTGNEASDKIDLGVVGLLNDTGIDGLTSGMDSSPFSTGDLSTVPGITQGLIPTGTCVAYSQDVLGFGLFEITCEDTALLRLILSWVLYVITAVYLFQLVIMPVRS